MWNLAEKTTQQHAFQWKMFWNFVNNFVIYISVENWYFFIAGFAS